MVKYIESETLELKEKYNDSICKEIVSFLNANGGTIIIGVTDDGAIVGVSKIDETMLKISDIITNQIEPNPQDEVTVQVKFDEGKMLISIEVSKGIESIYCIKKYGFSATGCPIRIGTSCKEMSKEQIRNRYIKQFNDVELMLKKRSSYANLTFKELKIYYAEKGYHLDESNFEANLKLRNDKGEYNLLAELVADHNNIPIIFVKFDGYDKSSISQRTDFGYGCIITAYEKIKNRLKAENINITDTTVRPRKDTYLFDMDCVNEAIVNALVHNDWTITEPQISMFNDRLEILSHGGLPDNLTQEQFFSGISLPRNATLMRIFLTSGISEHTGHGIPTIIKTYGKDVFDIQSNYIKCTIPFNNDVMGSIQKNIHVKKPANYYQTMESLTKTEAKIIYYLMEDCRYTAKQLSPMIGVSQRTIERNMASLQDKKIIERFGNNRSGGWKIIK